eukprot:Plantae.Rhodophyta-Hildenbrandia_rubra.ctg5109.p1 GENE.Plantae.Rhodophyta-Hildenbrandia_rubra.ctg5109~~Plantae.Rhodophyta-Hildenbrandia_rubra.ctg5109.p1  ORF type:complete len:539 (+),score=69.42 Plantae.Rhodophyta-Hildenbrandia_rubra.ctg5109:157-1773(+)
MRVAIIGGNFLACATSFYLHKSLDNVEITIFEKSERLGGEKFRTLSIKNSDADDAEAVDVVVGRMSRVDVKRCGFLKELLKEANVVICGDGSKERESFGIFDWDRDEYIVWNGTVGFKIWILLLVVIGLIWAVGSWKLRWSLQSLRNLSPNVVKGLCIVILFATPMLWYGGRRIMTNLQAHMGFRGAPSISEIIENSITEHLDAVRRSSEATSKGISMTHFLSRCGLMKYVKESAFEKYGEYGIGQKFIAGVVEPAMQVSIHAGAHADHSCNALAAFLSVAQSSSLRRNALYISATESKIVCNEITKAANAKVRVNSEVVSIDTDGSFEKYNLNVKTTGETPVGVNGFDAVIICCAVDPSQLSFPASESYLSNIAHISSKKENRSQIDNAYSQSNAKFVNIIRGKLKPDFFGDTREMAVPNYVSLIKCPGFHSITRLTVKDSKAQIYRVYSHRDLSEDTKNAELIFNEIQQAKSISTKKQTYSTSPMRLGDDTDVPAIILEKRCIYAGAVKRVGGGVELDCMMALNVASLLSDKARWK